MEQGTLMSQADTDMVTREQLALIDTPLPTRSFKPVPHIELIETLEQVLARNQITIRKEQFALRRDGSTLFGVLQLAYQDTQDGMAALGLRTANNRTMSIQLCAGMKNFRILEMQWGEVPWRGDLLRPVERFVDGMIAVPEGPGFGVALNEELAREKRM